MKSIVLLFTSNILPHILPIYGPKYLALYNISGQITKVDRDLSPKNVALIISIIDILNELLLYSLKPSNKQPIGEYQNHHNNNKIVDKNIQKSLFLQNLVYIIKVSIQ